ncbi:hypothetical protein K2173_020118 [Erythroxylum novogranatense]|nr:hypothetical protein K2173_020118 [Erythroxylum novogranatense]
MKVYVIILCLLLAFVVFSPPDSAAEARFTIPNPFRRRIGGKGSPFKCRSRKFCIPDLPPIPPPPPKRACFPHKRHCA